MKIVIVVLILGLVVFGGIILLAKGASGGDVKGVSSIASSDGEKQTVEITAKGGYAPRVTNAKADTAIVIKVKTEGTFDCSSALRIPEIGYRKSLPPSGITEINIPAQKSGSTLQGLCAMGMYSFKINFN